MKVDNGFCWACECCGVLYRFAPQGSCVDSLHLSVWQRPEVYRCLRCGGRLHNLGSEGR